MLEKIQEQKVEKGNEIIESVLKELSEKSPIGVR